MKLWKILLHCSIAKFYHCKMQIQFWLQYLTWKNKRFERGNRKYDIDMYCGDEQLMTSKHQIQNPNQTVFESCKSPKAKKIKRTRRGTWWTTYFRTFVIRPRFRRLKHSSQLIIGVRTLLLPVWRTIQKFENITYVQVRQIFYSIFISVFFYSFLPAFLRATKIN